MRFRCSKCGSIHDARDTCPLPNKKALLNKPKPLPNVLPNTPSALPNKTGASRQARWRQHNQEAYRDYMREYMRRRRAI